MPWPLVIDPDVRRHVDVWTLATNCERLYEPVVTERVLGEGDPYLDVLAVRAAGEVDGSVVLGPAPERLVRGVRPELSR
jgi:hypothetical protein